MATTDLWTYRDATWTSREISGYEVEAIDGGIGKIDESTSDVGASYIVVDTGPWIFGKKVMLPAGVIDRVDHANQTVYVDRTKDEIKNAPEFDAAKYQEDTYRDELDRYYGRARSRF